LSLHEVARLVEEAVDAGFRHFDCAYFYRTEAAVGAGLRRALSRGAVTREDLFLTSKVTHFPLRISYL